MSRIIIGVIIGLFLGIGAFIGGNYIGKKFVATYTKQAFAVPQLHNLPLKSVAVLVPQQLEVENHKEFYLIKWRTSQPVIGYVLLINNNLPFNQVKNRLRNSTDVYLLKVDKRFTIEHNIKVSKKLHYNYFYILEQTGEWIIPYGRKVYRNSGASDPYKLVNK